MKASDIFKATFIGELPDSNEQWQVAVYDGTVVLVNNDHDPRAVINGKLVVLKAKVDQGDLI